jgi:hypothetical protein
MPEKRTNRHASLSSRISLAFRALWTEYADEPPSKVRTEINGNVVTCRLIDSVGAFNRAMVAPRTRDPIRGTAKLTSAGYKRDAVAAIVRLTQQRVASLISSHDQDTDVATEVFTLEPSLQMGRPR